jgi:hypothetical protein
MRRILLVLSVAALMAAMLVASAVPAFAAHSRGHGEPNKKACQGVVIGGLAHSFAKKLPPPRAIEDPFFSEEKGYSSVKDYTEGAREGDFGVRPSYDPTDITQCPKGE